MSNTLTKEERITLLIEHSGGKTKFGVRLGMSPQSVSSWLKRGTYDSDALALAFPEISSEWILRGTGPMLEADIEKDEDFALDTLGITREQLATIRATVTDESPSDNNKECTPTRAYEDYTPDIYHVAEGQAVDRALLNMLLAEKAHLQQELAVLRQRNLELEKLYAIEHDRLENAEHWYRTNIQKK